MSSIAEILDRLSGVAVLRERVGEMSRRLDKAADMLLDHEKRLLRLEAVAAVRASAPPPAALPPA